MEIIEKNDVSLLSHIIYKIYNTKNSTQMRSEVLNLIKYAVPFDTANFFLVKSDFNGQDSLVDLINENSLKNRKLDNVLQSYMQRCSEIDCTHWLCDAKKSMAYRTTDYVSEASLENSDYYKEMFLPYDVHFGAQTVLAHQDTCVGLLTLYRSKDSTNFTDKEIFYLDALKDHLSTRLYIERFHNKPADYSADKYIERYDLTRREGQILDLLYHGLTNERIAEQLSISENTLRKHLYNLFRKLNINHRWEIFFLD